ncbi:prolyl oligopeptidase family serine peptidase [Actinoplanes sp. LDG1-06]|uniref:Prolyl oligopeptidase family serine peptidase n=1 Tax=Paractinoplanes ovalisporus TaxID=2810368 RepID=A0ABS2ANV1_9ACTN|nr:prolyl oligopeptidase family serine peptidase [Actinoplanes ovalisporus]MBM2621485.1 prolyl oligopeptidase family serine peptidase [Actinoplanes ovalisporus]
MLISFPRLYARTQGFRLGRPQRFVVAPDGKRLLFLRSGGGEDAVRRLYSLDLATGDEKLLVDPDAPADGTVMSAAERARRERARDRSAGISDYSADSPVRLVAFTADEKLFVVDTADGRRTELPARTPLLDATMSPDGTTVAYVHDGELRTIGVDGTGDRALATPEAGEVTYGLAEHVAGESMERHRGFWWSPDGRRLAVARVDNSPVEVWYLSDPAEPSQPPTAHRYPVAGTANAIVELLIMGEGEPVKVNFDWDEYEYLVDVVWDAHGLMAVVQNRSQGTLRIVAVEPETGRTRVLAETTDPSWTTIVPGFPRRTREGSLIWTADRGDTRRLTVDGEPVTPAGLQVAELCAVDGDTVLFTASSEPTERHLWTWSAADGLTRLTTEPGWHTGFRAGGTTVISSGTLDRTTTTWPGGTVRDLAVKSPVVPKVSLVRAGRLELRTAVLFPSVWQRGERLPVLMDPYGGPGAQIAVADRRMYYVSQWFADQGFAVIVADGRGTPGRGPRWEREAAGRSATKLLDDQIEALETVAALYPELDLDRVGIRGWSAGGYLAALAVLRRPDVFHAAVAGAPVTDLRLYDTHWQERFMGLPSDNPTTYEENSLIADAPKLERPLMLIHGLSDDNVYPVHTMRLSAALLAAGKTHTVLPLPGASHIPPDTDLLTPELHFLRESLAAPR